MNKWVSIGSTRGHDYSFFLPFQVLFWRRAGYEPLLFLTESSLTWHADPVARLAMEETRNLTSRTRWVGDMPGYQLNSISQAVRQHACLFVPDNDLLIMGDVDLLPLCVPWYHQHDPAKHDIALYYCNGCGDDQMAQGHFPTCHMSMLSRTWKEVMGIDVRDTLQVALRKTFESGGITGMKGMDVWYFDQTDASKRITRSRYFPQQVHFIPREGWPPTDRIDRCCWPERYDATQFTDTHVLRPGYTDKNWPRLRPLFKQLLPQHLAWADEYAAHFRKAMGYA